MQTLTWANLSKEWTLAVTIIGTNVAATFTGGADIRAINNLEKGSCIKSLLPNCKQVVLHTPSLMHTHSPGKFCIIIQIWTESGFKNRK